MGRLDFRSLLYCLFLKSPTPTHLALRLHNPPKEFSFNPQNISKANKIWTDPAVGWS